MLGKDERAELDAFKSDVLADVKGVVEAAKAHVARVVAPFQPLAQDVAQLKADTSKQTPLIERIASELHRSARERKRRVILDEQKHADALKWKKRYRAVLGLLAGVAALAELYRAWRG